MPTTRELVDAIKQAHTTSLLEEDECEPYKHKYEAADLLKKVLGERAVLGAEPAPGDAAGSSNPVSTASQEADAQVPVSGVNAEHGPQHASQPCMATAAARIRCGLILLETDLLHDGETSIASGLPPLEKSPDNFLAWLLESYNALGALYSQRGELPTALSWLQRAEQLYQRVTASGTRHAHLALPIAGLEPATAAAAAGASQAAEAAAAEAAPAEAEAPREGLAGSGAQQRQEAAPGREGPQQAEEEAQSGSAAEQQQREQEREQQEAGQGRSQQADGREGPGTQGGKPQAPASAASGASAAASGTNADSSPSAAGAAGAAVDNGAGEPSCRPVDEAAGPAAATDGSSGSQANGAAPPAPSAASAAAASAAAPSAADLDGPGSPPLHTQLPANDSDAVQAQYTSTLYYLAQVYGHMKVADRSALYCAATLYRQLASGKYELDTWVNNCLQLGGYYAKVHAYGIALYCHAAAQAVVDRDTAAGRQLGEDIAANLKLATARLHAMRLSASHSRHIEGKELEVHYPDVSYFPDYLRFPGLQVPSPDSFPWGAQALAADFEGARELFNTAMPYFKAALSYYQLDGYVTDHVGILMDMSNLYRCLAAFESDPGRCAAMQRCRAQLLEPLSGQLNPSIYTGLSRSIDLELAHVCREVSDVRERQGGQAAKAASAASSAVKYYQRFLRSFASGEGGQLPDRIDPDNEPYFLMASFGLGRMLHRIRTKAEGPADPADPGYAALVVSAHQHLQWTSAYVKRHGLEAWTEEAQAAEELSELLVERMRLQALTAARKGAAR